MPRENAQAVTAARPKVPMRRLGTHCLVVAMRWIGSTDVGSTGSGRNLIINGRRQPSHGGTSRMMREYHVRICEGLGVQLPGSTRQSRLGGASCRSSHVRNAPLATVDPKSGTAITRSQFLRCWRISPITPRQQTKKAPEATFFTAMARADATGRIKCEQLKRGNARGAKGVGHPRGAKSPILS